MIIESRRNFLVRAAGFIAAASPLVTSAAWAKADLPVITPEIAATMATWRRAFLDREAIRAGGPLPGIITASGLFPSKKGGGASSSWRSDQSRS